LVALGDGRIEVTGEFYDQAASSADPIESRPGFAALLDRIGAVTQLPMSPQRVKELLRRKTKVGSSNSAR
jgi:hypothetical protein